MIILFRVFLITPELKDQVEESLISLEYDNHLNFKSSKIFNQSIEPSFLSKFNTAEIFNSYSGFNILFDQLNKKKKFNVWIYQIAIK